jgi:hypothetical protein
MEKQKDSILDVLNPPPFSFLPFTRAWLTILCNVTSLLPLLAMRLLDGVGDMTEADKDSFPVKRNTFPRVEDCGVADGVED